MRKDFEFKTDLTMEFGSRLKLGSSQQDPGVRVSPRHEPAAAFYVTAAMSL